MSNTHENKMKNNIIEQPSINDAKQLGKLLFLVDPYIYPSLFGTQKQASEIMPLLMSIKNSFFAPEYFYVMRENNIITGLILRYNHPFEQTPKTMIDFCKNHQTLLPESAIHVCTNYFIPVCENLKPNETYIPSIVTHPDYRHKGIATTLLRTIENENQNSTLALDTLANNTIAISTYTQYGFQKQSNITNGYAYKQPAPKVFRMIKQSSMILNLMIL